MKQPINIYLFLKPFLGGYLIALFCITISSIISLLYPLVFKTLVDDVLIKNNFKMLFSIILIYIILFVLALFFNFLTAFVNERNSQFFSFNLKKRLFAHFQKMPLTLLNQTSMGELISNFNTDVDTINNFISQELIKFVTNVLNILIVMVVLLILKWQLAVLLIFLVPFFFLTSMITSNHFVKFAQESRELVTEGNNLYQNVFYNIKLVKLFIAQRKFMKRFLQWQNKVISVSIKRVVVGNFFQQIMVGIFLVGNVIIIWDGSLMVFQHQLTLGGLVSFLTYIPTMFFPIGALINTNIQLQNFKTSANRISKYLDLEIEKTIKSKNKITGGDISYQDVFFKYGDKLVLKDINIFIKSGEKVALIGANGSGKTTMVNLLLRLYDIQQGRISIDGIDITKFPLNHLRKRIGMVTQEVNFFNLSIEDNMIMSNPGCSSKDIINACQITGAHEFISRLSEGYKTVIGERGHNFSGGQLQKMALTRLIIKNPEIIIFDEATSALDQESTQYFYQIFESVFKDRTILFILHDLKSIVYADKVILLKDGMIKNIFEKKEFTQSEAIYQEIQRYITEV